MPPVVLFAVLNRRARGLNGKEVSMPQTDLHDVNASEIIDRWEGEPAPFLSILHEIQAHYGYLPEPALHEVSSRLGIPLAELYGTVTFYHFFELEEPGTNPDLWMCESSACCLKDLTTLERQLSSARLDTPHSGRVRRIPCPGRCDIAVPVFVGDRVYASADSGSANDLPLATSALPANIGVEECIFADIRKGIDTLAGYRAVGGYSTLETAAKDPQKILDELKVSGLTGRGGAGFPTGVKWDAVRKETKQPKYIVCNADEGEPGCFKDRCVMDNAPHQMIEGMVLAALVTGAEIGIVYLRFEYPETLASLQKAIDDAVGAGYLGENILGTGHHFKLVIRRGAGAYICGEETSLLNSLEGSHPFPRDKPPFPTTHGLFGRPTVINNVETFATAAMIIRKGGAWFAGLGLGENQGTRVFSVSGDIARPGNYELPIGTPLSTLLNQHAGGAPNGRTIQGVTMAGISGGFVGAADLDVPLDSKSLAALGGMLGAGGIIVHDDTRCMVSAARASMNFLAHESCGKCCPCRIGMTRSTEILDEMRTHAGGGPAVTRDAVSELADLDEVMAEASACGLGLAAPFVTRTLMKYWPDQVEAHLRGECPTGACERSKA